MHLRNHQRKEDGAKVEGSVPIAITDICIPARCPMSAMPPKEATPTGNKPTKTPEDKLRPDLRQRTTGEEKSTTTHPYKQVMTINPVCDVTNGHIYVHTAAREVKKIMALIGPYLNAYTPPIRRPNADTALEIATRSKARLLSIPMSMALTLRKVNTVQGKKIS